MPIEKLHRIYPLILQRSRDMRHPLTSAEKKVWDRVRNQQLGFKIRRQHPFTASSLTSTVLKPSSSSK